MVALPGQLFYSTPIPACLWFLARDKSNGKKRNRRGEILFIDARKLGVLRDRTHRELIDEDIDKISQSYHAWRNGENYQDMAGFCMATDTEKVKESGYALTPGRFVGTEYINNDSADFHSKMNTLTLTLAKQFELSHALEETIKNNFKGLGHEF